MLQNVPNIVRTAKAERRLKERMIQEVKIIILTFSKCIRII